MTSAQYTPLAKRPWPELDVSGARILVTGFGVSGYAIVDQTLQRGALVTAVDAATDQATQERARILEVLGADIRLGAEHTQAMPPLEDGAEFDVVVTSPGWRPDQPIFRQARERGIPVWSEIELARRMQPVDGPQWLTVTGTNGKTTVVSMLESILRCASFKALAVGNVGLPLIEAALAPEPLDVLAVELSSFQLHWTENLEAHSSAIVNIGEDHLDWHGSIDEYAAAKGKIYRGTRYACLYNLNDERTLRQLEEADVQEGCRAIGVGLGAPGPSDLGVVEDLLVDRAFCARRHTQAAEIASADDLAHLGAHGAPPHMIFNALVAAGLARSFGVEPVHVRDGLRAFSPGAHRNEVIARVGGVVYVDDSKATNPDSAAASLAGAKSVVWIAGGDTKGASLASLIQTHSDRIKHVVLIGQDPSAFQEALNQHAPEVSHQWIDPANLADAAALMESAVHEAARVADNGDVVLLAPAAASIDQFASYAHRGQLFADAVRAFGGSK